MAELYEAKQVQDEGSGMPQLNPDSYASQVFWLAIVFIALYLMMAGSVIPRIRNVLGKRQHQIQHDLDTAEKAKSDAQKAKQTYETELANAKDKASSLIQQTQKEIDAFMAAEHEKLGITLEAMLEESEESLQRQRASSRKEIEPLVEALTAQIAESIMGSKPSEADVKQAVAKAEGTA